MKKLKKKIKKIDIKEIYEDAIAAPPSAAPSDGNASSTENSVGVGTSDINVLGNCDHNSTGGYMKDGCFHLPVKVMKTLKRFDIDKNKVSKKKKHKKQHDYSTKS